MATDSLVCPSCQVGVERDDFPAHQRDCRGARPKLPATGWLIRLDAGRVHIITLGPSLLIGLHFIEADWSVTEMGAAMHYLKTQLEEQGE